MPVRVPAASRRTTLGLAAGGVLAAAVGCDADTPLPGGDDQPSATVTAPPQDADEQLVERLRSEVVAVLAVVRGARGRPPLAAAVRSLEAMHVAHLVALDGEDRGRAPRRTPGSLAQVRRQLDTRERRHQRVLARSTDRAVSGDLAALLATMTAGTAQHLSLQ